MSRDLLGAAAARLAASAPGPPPARRGERRPASSSPRRTRSPHTSARCRSCASLGRARPRRPGALRERRTGDSAVASDSPCSGLSRVAVAVQPAPEPARRPASSMISPVSQKWREWKCERFGFGVVDAGQEADLAGVEEPLDAAADALRERRVDAERAVAQQRRLVDADVAAQVGVARRSCVERDQRVEQVAAAGQEDARRAPARRAPRRPRGGRLEQRGAIGSALAA